MQPSGIHKLVFEDAEMMVVQKEGTVVVQGGIMVALSGARVVVAPGG